MTKDNTLFILILILLNFALISLTTLFSLARYDLFLKQIFFWFLGFLLFFSFKIFDYKLIFERFHFIFIIFLSFLILILVLFVPGKIKSWFIIGPLSFQPSEFSKLGFFLILTKFFSLNFDRLNNFFYLSLSFLIISPFIFLIFLQPDMGMVFLYFLVWFFSVFFFLRRKTIIYLGTIGILILLVFWLFIFKDYQKERIISFLTSFRNPLSAEYNLRQIRIILSTTSFFGRGVGLSEVAKYGYLPSAATDFILTSLIEERGYFGYLMIFFLYSLLLYEIYKIYFFTKIPLYKNFLYLVLIYFTVKFVLTSLINFGLFPIIGLPFPFLSYGGSHLIFDLWLLGIVYYFKTLK